MNKTILIGRVGKDPEVRYTATGTAIASLTLATTKRFKDKDGNRQDKTSWHNVVVFGKTGEFVGNYIKKGNQISVVGEIEYQEWESNGEKKYRTVINAEDVQNLTPKGDDAPRNANSKQSSNRQANSDDDFDEDIPF